MTTTPTPIQAVIFDMDGLLIDSEPLWCQAQIDVFRQIGYPYSAADCPETLGVRIDQAVAHYYERRPWPGPPPEEIVRRVLERMVNLIAREGRPRPGALEIVDFFRRRDIRIAVASSSPHRIIGANIRALGLEDAFEVICSGEDERYGKPHPAVYISAADRLEVDRRRCLVFEDSIMGLLAAKAAEMICVCVPDADNAADKRLAIADFVLNSLVEFDQRLWSQIIGY